MSGDIEPKTGMENTGGDTKGRAEDGSPGVASGRKRPGRPRGPFGPIPVAPRKVPDPNRPHTNQDHPLTEMQRRFVSEYLVDRCAAKALVRAGYSPNGAAVNASRMLRDPRIRDALREFQDKLSADLEITPKRVLQEWAQIAFGNVDDFVDREGRIDLTKATREQMGTVAEVTSDVVGGGSEDSPAVTRVRIKFHSKTQALEALSKHLGLFEQDNRQKGIGAFLEFLQEKAIDGTNFTERLRAIPSTVVPTGPGAVLDRGSGVAGGLDMVWDGGDSSECPGQSTDGG